MGSRLFHASFINCSRTALAILVLSIWRFCDVYAFQPKSFIEWYFQSGKYHDAWVGDTQEELTLRNTADLMQQRWSSIIGSTLPPAISSLQMYPMPNSVR